MKKYFKGKAITLVYLLAAIVIPGQASLTENYIAEKTCYDADCVKKAETVAYFDGLGRAKQTVKVKFSPTNKDVVEHFEYDPFGRQTKNYLPVPQAGTQNGAIYGTPLSNASASYGSEKIYSENVPENSPLDRIRKKIQLGNDWTAHPANYSYGANTLADAVKKFTVTTVWEDNVTKATLGQSGNYPDNQLYKNTIQDEDGFAVIEFTNSNDQVILKRKEISSGNYADTYYVYNDYDQLALVIPPLAGAKATLLQTDLDELCYQYRYDNRYRLAEKKLPGKGWEYMLYDKQDRLVATQDANQRANNQWLYTKYDKFGRVAITGICVGGSRYSEQLSADGAGSNNVNRFGSVYFNRQGMDVYYDNPDGSYPNSLKWVTLLTINYYDDYPAYSFSPAFPASILNEPTLKQDATIENVSTKSFPVLNLIKNIENDNWTKKYTYYDKKGRAIGQHVINHLGGYTREEKELDFTGQTKKIKKFHKRFTTDSEIVITEDFELDHQNRVTKHWHQVNSQPQELLADNTYNERSLLTNKKVGNNLQSIDQEFDVRGWLTKINDPANLNGKLFGYQLRYHNPEPNALGIEQAKYNGNIAEVDWKAANDGILKRYSYKYDGLNRLIYGICFQPQATVPNEDYFEYLQYDRNGNITSLSRGSKGAGSSNITELIDELNYSYEGNRLVQITDATGNASGYPGGGFTIKYDENGNMTSMSDKKIKLIIYNFLNLPNDIVMSPMTGGIYSLYHTYRADGIKVAKKYTKGSTSVTTDYLDGFQYEHSPIPPTSPDLKFVSTAEGYYSFENNKYIYQYKDQLGNVRVSFYKDANGNAVIDNAADFYPFGLEHSSNATFSPITPAYRYDFQSQEKQVYTGWSSFKWRNYDYTIGRFFNVDPLSEDYNEWSNYAFSGNRVIDARELEGLEPEMVNESNNGLPDDVWEFGAMIREGVNSVRASVSNLVGRGINTVSGDRINNKYEVDNNGFLVLMTGVPKETPNEKAVNTIGDLATIGLAAAGGPQGVLMSQGTKPAYLKAFESVKKFQKIEARAEKLNKVAREGKDFTKAGKENVIDRNTLKYGKTKCEKCGINTTPAEQSKKGVVPKRTETQVDHNKRKRENGRGNPDNGQVYCRRCNLEKH